MKKSIVQITSLVLFGIFSAIFLVGCNTKCTKTLTYVKQVPIYRALGEIRASFAIKEPTALLNPGKIHVKGNLLFIVDQRKGVHVVNNADPANPAFIKFIQAAECIDVSTYQNMMIVNQGPDLVTLNIQDINNIQFVGRQNNVMNTDLIKQDSFVVDYQEKEVVEVVEDANCGSGGGFGMREDVVFSPQVGGNSSGVSGSMARFSVIGDFLYVVDNNAIISFGLKNQQSPKMLQSQQLGNNMETIFGFSDKIFIGSATGMFIMEANNGNPRFLSSFNHARGCDPVVVRGNQAFVTLRGNGACGEAEDELHVVDITNLLQPSLQHSFPMNEPYGLGIDDQVLAVCDGSAGLRLFDGQKIPNLLLNEFAPIKEGKTYDVIMLGSHLILTSDIGIFQYDISSPQQPLKLSALFAK